MLVSEKGIPQGRRAITAATCMTDAANDKRGQEGHDKVADIEAFVAQLSEEERMLVILQDQLYEHSWEAMLDDLRNRLDGKPFIFKLAHRIQDDITRIEKLKDFEEKHHTKLADFVEPPKS